MQIHDGADPRMQSSLELCLWLVVLRLAILIPLFAGALALAWFVPEHEQPRCPRSAWTDELDLKPLSELPNAEPPAEAPARTDSVSYGR